MRNWETWVREYLNLPAMSGDRDRRIVAELAAHLEDAWHEARAGGATEEEADALVAASVGDRVDAARDLLCAERHHVASEAGRRLERAEERWRARGRLGARLSDVAREARLTARTLAQRPAFAAIVVAVLAVGIGATTAVFTLVHAILLSPLPFPNPERLVSLTHRASGAGGGAAGQCAAWHVTYTEENRVFEDLGMYSFGRAEIAGDGEPEAPRTMVATSGVFRALGIVPVAGRLFTIADEDPDAPPVVLLSYPYWRTRFGGDVTVVGRTLRVNGQVTEIVGILPEALGVLGQDPSVVLPIRYRRAELFVGNVGYNAVARLRPGVTGQQAVADMARMLPMAFEKFPGGPVIEAARQANYVPDAIPLDERLMGSAARLLWILLAGAAVLFLVALANIANLFLVRADGRQREMAVRTAMGATRRQIGWEYVRESIVLGLVGGLAGLGVAYLGLRALVVAALSQLPRLDQVTVSQPALLLTLTLSIGAGVLFGVLPMLRQDRHGIAERLKAGGHAGVGGRRRHRIQNLLAMGQLALVFVLLVASGLVLRSTSALWKVDPGFRDAERLLTVSVRIGAHHVQNPADVSLQQEAIARRLGEIAGVDGVAMGTSVPMVPGGNINPLYVDGITAEGRTPPITRRHKWVGEGYFDTLGIPVVAGRALTWEDAHHRMPIVVLSRSIAVAYWGSVDEAMGKRVSVRPDPVRWHEVVGIAEDVREDGMSEDPVPMVYWPQVTTAFWEGAAADDLVVWRHAAFAIRSDRVGTPGFVDDVQRAIWSVNGSLPVTGVGTLAEYTARSMARTTFALVLLAVAAGAALVLGLVGVYGVVSYAVSQRIRELGVRMALGAGAGSVRRMVLLQGLRLASAGSIVGLGLALGGMRVMEGLLFGVSPTDPITLGTVALGLLVVALAASYVPAYRASRVDPLVVLRAE